MSGIPQPEFDDGSRLDVDADVIAGWRDDFDRIDSHRHLSAVSDPPEPPAEAWRVVRFADAIDPDRVRQPSPERLARIHERLPHFAADPEEPV